MFRKHFSIFNFWYFALDWRIGIRISNTSTQANVSEIENAIQFSFKLFNLLAFSLASVNYVLEQPQKISRGLIQYKKKLSVPKPAKVEGKKFGKFEFIVSNADVSEIENATIKKKLLIS